MTDSPFDPNLFLNVQIEEAISTEYTPIPEADYTATIKNVSARQSNKDSKTYTMMDVEWKLDAPEAEDANGRPVRQSLFLDLNAGGTIDSGKGRNVQLGLLLQALGLNGQPWSPKGLEGRVARVKVKQRAGTGDYEGQTFSEVKAVSAL